MSNEIILVTGGMRSGKSRFAEQLLADGRERFISLPLKSWTTKCGHGMAAA